MFVGGSYTPPRVPPGCQDLCKVSAKQFREQTTRLTDVACEEISSVPVSLDEHGEPGTDDDDRTKQERRVLDPWRSRRLEGHTFKRNTLLDECLTHTSGSEGEETYGKDSASPKKIPPRNSHQAFKAANAVRFCNHWKAAEAPPLPALKKESSPTAQQTKTQIHGTPCLVSLVRNRGAWFCSASE